MGSICTAEAPAFSVIIAQDFGVADVNLESKPDHELFAEGDASGSKALVPKTRRAPSLQNFCVGDAAGDGLSTEERASVARTPPTVKWGGEVEERCEQVLLGMLRSTNTTPVSTYLTLVPKLHPALSKPLRLAERLSVAVIGGGVAGLLTAKWMQEEGHRVVIFEAEDHLGGIWSKGSSRLYPTLHSNTPRSWMHFSDFEFPAPDTGSLEFPHHSMVTAQVHAYVEKFGLAKLAQLNSRVDKVSRAGDTWRVTVNGIDQHFDRVCLCNGKLQEPAVPALPGPGGAGSSSPRIFSDWQSSGSPVACLECETQQKRGSTLFFHSSRLGTLGTGVFAGRHVVVVGFGQASGADVCELAVAKGAASVTVVVQKPIFLLPRMLDQKPIEEQMTVLSVLQPQLLPLLAQLPGLQKFPANCPQEFTMGVHTATRVWTLHEMIARGRVAVRLGHVDHYEDGFVVLSNGGTLQADVVVWCTGYKSRALDVLEPGVRESVIKDAPLYEGMWAPEAPGLALIGHDESIWYFMEMQARWAARVWSGRAAPLPSPQVMKQQIAQVQMQIAQFRPHVRRQPPPFSVPGEALTKLLRMALLAGVWPSPSQVVFNLFSTFEPRFAHGTSWF